MKRRKVYCRLNFAIPPPGPRVLLDLTDEEEYIISRCIVAMRISNRKNDGSRPHQSKRTGHATILPLDFAHTYADYSNQHPFPRSRDKLLFYDVIQEGGGDKEYTFRVNADRMHSNLIFLKDHNEEYQDIVIDDTIFDNYRRNPEVSTRVVHLDDDIDENARCWLPALHSMSYCSASSPTRSTLRWLHSVP